MDEESDIKQLDKGYEKAINNLQRLTIDGKMIWVPVGSNRFAATKEQNPELNVFQIVRRIEVGPSGFSTPQFEIVIFPSRESPKIAYAVSITYPFPDSIERLHEAVVRAVDKQKAAFAKLFLEAGMGA